MIDIVTAEEADFEEIWLLFHSVVKRGDTYAFAPNTSRAEAYTHWITEPQYTFVALDNQRVVGTYMLKKNQVGLGSHVANAGFMVAPAYRSQGLGKQLCQHAIEQARQQGYKAMQFNFVVSSNEKAVNLWKSMGFEIVGTIPKAFQHHALGYTDVHIMYQWIAA